MVATKKGVSMKCVCEMQGMKENKNKNDNKHKELSCDEEKKRMKNVIRCQMITKAVMLRQVIKSQNAKQ